MCYTEGNRQLRFIKRNDAGHFRQVENECAARLLLWSKLSQELLLDCQSK